MPSGNFGDMLSGYIAKRMGVPIRRLIVATNENAVLDTLFKTGVYELASAQVTSSPSMDISKASNYERLAFDVLKRDAVALTRYMSEFESKKCVDLKDYGTGPEDFAKLGFSSDSSTHANRLQAIRDVYEKCAYVIDPHTADAVSVGFREKKQDGVPVICMGTALAVKFEDTIQEALGFIPERPTRFKDLEKALPEKAFHVVDVDAEQLRQYIRENI